MTGALAGGTSSSEGLQTLFSMVLGSSWSSVKLAGSVLVKEREMRKYSVINITWSPHCGCY